MNKDDTGCSGRLHVLEICASVRAVKPFLLKAIDSRIAARRVFGKHWARPKPFGLDCFWLRNFRLGLFWLKSFGFSELAPQKVRPAVESTATNGTDADAHFNPGVSGCMRKTLADMGGRLRCPKKKKGAAVRLRYPRLLLGRTCRC